MGPTIKLIRVNPDIDVPRYATSGSAAVDLQAAIHAPVSIYPGNHVEIPTGLKMWIRDPNIVGEILPRSGKGTKGYGIKNLTGLIDSDYQGEIMVHIWNTNRVSPLDDSVITIEPLEKIAQMLFRPVLRVAFDECDAFDETTVRGEGGFGHTDRLAYRCYNCDKLVSYLFADRGCACCTRLTAETIEGERSPSVQVLHEPHNRAMWHTDCESGRESPMTPLADTKTTAGGVKLQLWDCVACHKKAWFGYSYGRPFVEPYNAEPRRVADEL